MRDNESDPWSWLQPADLQRMGDVIVERKEQERWCRAVMLAGSLPYMWRHKAATVRELMYGKLEPRRGDRVLVIGEMVEACGFADDLRARVGQDGEVVVVDITEEARNAYMANRIGRGGQLATWKFDYTAQFAAQSFDCVAVLQAVQHPDDWAETARELLRVMKAGRRILLAEITFSPRMKMLAEQDIHIETWIEKLAARVGFNPFDAPYYSPAQLLAAFDGVALEPEVFAWKGIELLWATKPAQ